MALNNVKEIQIPTPQITGYTRVEYIQSTSSDCAINLNFIPTSSTKVDLTFEYIDASYTGWVPLYGERGSTNTTYFALHVHNTSLIVSPNYAGFDPGTNSTVVITRNTKYRVRTDGGNLYLNGILQPSCSTTNTLVTGNQYFYLFGRGQNNTYYTQNVQMKVYGMKVYEGNTLTRNLIPAKNSQNVYGLYDSINNVFYTPVSNNSLSGGNELTTIQVDKIEDPNGDIIWGSQSAFPYRRLEYIKFSGSEYILTETPANNYYFLQFSLDSIINDKFIFGCNGDTTSAGTMRITNRTSSTGYMQTRFGRNSSSNTNIAAISANTIYQMRLRVFANNTLYSALANSSGTVLGSNNFSAVSFTRANMNKFAIMGYGAGTTATNTSAGKVYWYFKREGDGASTILVRAYPCQRKSDNVCGLYDIINGVFYPMEGTNITDNAAGPLVDEY